MCGAATAVWATGGCPEVGGRRGGHTSDAANMVWCGACARNAVLKVSAPVNAVAHRQVAVP